MQLELILSELGALDTLEVLHPHWEDSLATLPEGELPFLRREAWQDNRQWLDMDAAADELFEAVASRINAAPGLRALAWHLMKLSYDYPESPASTKWPSFDDVFPEGGGVFYLLLGLDAVTRARAEQGRRGIPEEITRATCGDTLIMMHRYAALNDGRMGLEARGIVWHRVIASGELHRIGRFEYIMRPFRGPVRAYRHCSEGHLIALCEEGTPFDNEGFSPNNGVEPDWIAHLQQTEDTVTGSIMSPRGYAVQGEVTLSFEEWEETLVCRDMALEIHIPEGEAMTLEACRDSMGQALEFFPRHYPDRPFRTFACYSWILNTQLEEMLSEKSNLVNFQHEVYLFPQASNGRDGLYFLFYQDNVDINTAPRDTTLRRKYLECLESGGSIRRGGMFFLPEDLPQFGTQFYRVSQTV
jgi:hypothetical protein